MLSDMTSRSMTACEQVSKKYYLKYRVSIGMLSMHKGEMKAFSFVHYRTLLASYLKNGLFR